MKTRFYLLILLSALLFMPELSAQSKGRVAILQTVGVQGRTVIYNTYCLIGAMNDGYVNDAWEKDVVITIMDEQIGLMDEVSAEYDTLLSTGYLDEEDSAYVVEMRACCQLLKQEAACLKQYVLDDTEESHQKYFDAREAAWDRLAEVMGFNGQTSSAKNPFSGG